MSSFKLRGPSNSSLRDPANSTLRGSDGPLEFLKSLESILAATNNLQFQPSKALSLVGALASSIKSSTIYTTFSSSLSALSSFVRNVQSSRVSTLTGYMNSQSDVAHGVTVTALSNLLNVQRQNQLSKNISLVNNSLFQRLNNIAINRILSTTLSLIPTSIRLISFSIQSSFTNVFAISNSKLFNIVSDTSSALVKNMQKSLALSGAFATFLITPFTKFVELALRLTSLFESSIRKSVQNSLSLSASLTTQFNKNLQILLNNINSTFNVVRSQSVVKTISILGNTLTTSIQNGVLVLSSIQSSFNSSINNVIAKLIAATITTFNQIVAYLSSFMSLSINSSLDPKVLKNPNSLLNSTLTASVQIPRLTQASLSILASQSMTLLTQSFRFVSLAILSSQSAYKQTHVDFTINESAELLTTVNKSPSIILEAVLTNFQLALNRLVAVNQTAPLTSAASLQNLVRSSLALLLSSTLNISRALSVAITNSSVFASSVVATTSRLVTLAINNAFDVTSARIVRIFDSLNIGLVNSFNKIIKVNLKIVESLTGLIFTQSARFLSFAIASNQNLVQSFRVNAILNNLTTLTPSSNRQSIINLESVTLSFSTYFSKLVNFTILSTTNLFEGLFKSVSAFSSTALSSTVNFNKLFIITLSSINSFASNLFKITSTSITVAINNLFDANLSKIIYNSVRITTSLTNSFSRSISINVKLINSWSSLIFTQSLRFITLAINNSYAVSFIKQLSVTIAYINNLNTTIQKSITNVLNITSNFVAFKILNVRRASSISSIFNADLRRSYAKYLNYLSVLNTFLSPNSFYEQLLEVNLINTIAISTASLRFVSLTITSSYNQIISRLNAITKTVSLATVNSLLKRTSINIILSASYSVNIFNQAFRLVSLAVASAFNSTFALRIYSSANINNNFNTTNQFNIFKTIDRIIDLNSNFNRLIQTTLNVVSTFLGNLSRATSFNLSLSIISGFNNSISRITSILLNNNLSTSLSDQKSIEFNRSLSSNFIADVFYPSILRLISLSVLAAQNVSLNNAISKTINRTYASVLNISRNSLLLLQATSNSFILTIQNNIKSSLAIVTNYLTLFNKTTNYELPVNLQSSPMLFRKISFALSQVINNSLNLIKTTSALVSANLNVLFDTTITKAVDYAIATTVTLFNQFTNSINFTIRSLNNFASLIFTQSFRFITLAIVSGQNVNNNLNVVNTINNLTTFTTNTTRLISTTLSTIVSAPILFIRKVVLSTINAGTNFAATISNAISYSINGVVSSSLNIVKAVDKTLTQTIELASNIVKTTSTLITVSINSLFASNLNKLSNISVNTSTSFNNDFNKTIKFALSLNNNLINLIFTQSLRFLSFSILSSQNASQSVSVSATIKNVSTLSSSINRSIAFLIESVSDGFAAQINRMTSTALASSSNLIVSLQNTINFNVDATLQSLLNIQTQSLITLNNLLNTSVDVINLAFKALTLSINSLFNSSIQRLTNSTQSTSLTVNNNIQRSISFNIQLINTFANFIFTQSLRFVSLAITSGQNIAQQTRTFFSITTNNSLISNLSKNVSTTLQSAWASILTEIKSVVLPGIYTSVTSIASIQRTIGYNLQASAQSLLNITTRSLISITQNVSLIPNIIKSTSKLITMSINNLFEATLSRLSNITINANTIASNNLQKSIDFTLRSINTFSSLIFTQSFRFVSLAITSSQEVMQRIRISSLLTTTSSLIASFIKSIATTLRLVFNNSVIQIRSFVFTNINLLVDSVALIQKKVVSYNIKLNVESLLNISTKSFLTLITNLYLIPSVVKTTSALLAMTINNLFESSISRLTNFTINATNSITIKFNRVIDFNLNLLSNISSLIFTQSLRFVSLAIVSAQTISQRVAAFINLSSTVSLISNINRSIAVALESAWSSLIIEVKTVILPGIYVQVDHLVSISRSIKYQIVAGLQQGLNVQTSSFFAVTSAVTLAANILKTTSSLVAVALNNLFAANLSKTVNKFVDVTFTTTNNIVKSIEYSIKSINNFASLVLTQSLRFVSLAILSNQNTAQQVLISFNLNNVATLTTSIQNVIFTTLQSAWNNAVVEIKNVALPGIYVRINYLALTQKLTSLNILSTFTNAATWQSRSLIAISRSITFAPNIFKTTSSLISVAVNNLFEASLQRLSSITVPTNFTVDNSFSKSINFAVRIVNSFTALIFTQSLRFISLAIVSGQNLIIKTAASFSLSSTFSSITKIQQNIFNSIKTSFSSSIGEVKTVVLPGIYLSVNSIIAINKSIYYRLNAISSLITAFSRSINFSIVLELFNDIFINVKSKFEQLIEITLSSTSNISKAINKSIDRIVIFSSEVFNASNKIISLTVQSGFNTQIIKNTYKLISLVISRLKFTDQISGGFAGTTNFDNAVDLMLNGQSIEANPQSTWLMIKNVKTSLNLSNDYLTLVVSSFNKLVNLTLNLISGFNEQLQKLVMASLDTPSNFATNSIKFITVKLTDVLLSLDSQIFKNLQKFILNSMTLETTFNRFINQTISASVNSIVQFNKLIFFQIPLTLSINTQIIFRSSYYLTLNLIENFNTNFNKIIFNTVQGILATLSDIQLSINLLVSNVSGFSTNTVKNVQKYVTQLNITLSIVISELSAFFLSLNINSLFVSNIFKNAQITINFVFNSLTNIQKLGKITLQSVISFATYISFLSLRFVSLAILSAQETSRQAIVFFSLNNISSFVARISNQIILRMATSWMGTTTAVKNVILPNFVAIFENVVSIPRQVFRRLMAGLQQTVIIQTASRFTIFSITTLTTQVSKTASALITITVNNLFETNLKKSVNFLIDATTVASNNLIKSINFSITLLNNLISSVSIQSLRFVTLIIISEWRVYRNALIKKYISLIVIATSSINFNNKLNYLLEVIVNLPVRRSHTLYGILTIFATNKSQPGSDGSAQQTQRKTGGNARKRNINNNGSTLFRRGNTDDLE